MRLHEITPPFSAQELWDYAEKLDDNANEQYYSDLLSEGKRKARKLRKKRRRIASCAFALSLAVFTEMAKHK